MNVTSGVIFLYGTILFSDFIFVTKESRKTRVKGLTEIKGSTVCDSSRLSGRRFYHNVLRYL